MADFTPNTISVPSLDLAKNNDYNRFVTSISPVVGMYASSILSVVKPRNRAIDLVKSLENLSPSTWYMLFAAFLIISFTQYYLNRNERQTFIESLWQIFRNVVSQNNYVPKTIKARIVNFSFLFLILTIYQHYNCMIQTSLTVTDKQSVIDSLDDLLNRPNIRPLIIKGFELWDTFRSADPRKSDLAAKLNTIYQRAEEMGGGIFLDANEMFWKAMEGEFDELFGNGEAVLLERQLFLNIIGRVFYSMRSKEFDNLRLWMAKEPFSITFFSFPYGARAKKYFAFKRKMDEGLVVFKL